MFSPALFIRKSSSQCLDSHSSLSNTCQLSTQATGHLKSLSLSLSLSLSFTFDIGLGHGHTGNSCPLINQSVAHLVSLVPTKTMSSSTWYNSIYLPIALTCVSIVSLTVVLLISPNYFNINSFTSSSSSSSEETPPALLAASNSLLNDASYSDSDNLPEDEASSASLASQVSSDMSNKNTAYTNDNSLPVAR